MPDCLAWRCMQCITLKLNRPEFSSLLLIFAANMAALIKKTLINPVLINNGIFRLQFVRLAGCEYCLQFVNISFIITVVVYS